MRDLAAPHKGVRHFGVWAEEDADALGSADALAILHAGIASARDRDMKHDGELAAALDWLIEQSGARCSIVQRYRQALDIAHPITRHNALAAAYRGICAAVAGAAADD